MGNKLKYSAFLLIWVLQCFYWQLDAKPIHKIQELRVAETAREMVANQNWITPYYNGELRLRKPPLAYWVAATSYSVSGVVNEFTARVGSVAFAAAAVFVLFFWLRKIHDARIALSAVAVLASTYLGLRYCRNAETDAMLVFFILLACIQVYKLVFEGGGRTQARWLYLFMGLGFLTKGPAALAIPLGVWLILAIQQRRFQALKTLRDPLGIGVLLVVAFGWYVWMYVTLPDMWKLWVTEEIDATYITGTHQQPLYWYALNLWKFFAPWSVFIPVLAFWLYKKRPHAPLVQLAFAWFVLTFVLLTLNPSKQIQYALLLNPPLAILIGYYLATATGVYDRINRWLFGLIAVALAAVAVLVLLKWRDSFTPLVVLAIVGGALLPTLVALLLRLGKDVPYRQLLLAGAAVAGTLYNQVNLYSDASDRFEVEGKHFSLTAKEYSPLYAFGLGDGIYSFYAQRVVPPAHDLAEVEALIVQESPIYIALEHEAPKWPATVDATQVFAKGEFSLWRLNRAGAAP